MLKSIKSLNNTKISINFETNLSRHIYEFDSVNLIIGKNGSGKTKLIKDIIKQIFQKQAPKKFSILGDTNNLGIIYYTGSPFHKPFYNGKKFVDASTFVENRKFNDILYEHHLISKNLNIPLRGVVEYSLRDAIIFIGEAVSGRSASTINTNTSQSIRQTILKLKSIKKEESDLNRLLNEEHGDPNDKALSKIYEDQQLLYTQRNLVYKSLVDEFIGLFDTSKQEELIAWLSFCCLMNDTKNLPDAKKIAFFLYKFDYAGLNNKLETPKKWSEIFHTAKNLGIEMNRYSIGEIVFNKTDCSIGTSIDVEMVMNGKMDGGVYISAYDYSLIGVGFSKISSGEAAILHQVASISQAIHVLLDRKNNNVSSILLFIDGGDMLLHLEWQRRYFEIIGHRLSSIETKLDIGSIQLIVATHSPLLAADVFKESILQLDENSSTVGFGASIQEIINYSFNTPAIGAVSESFIKRIRRKSKITPIEKEIIEKIDNEFIRNYLITGRDNDYIN